MTTRRELFRLAGAGLAAPLAGAMSGALAAADSASAAGAPSSGAAPVRVHTLNGRSLKSQLRNGVREFHLIAEEVDHEFAPGTRVKAWGYNGSTPGPTLECTEGEPVRIRLTNRLPEHTSMHWHGILLPNGMDGVGGLTQPHVQPGETWVYEFTPSHAGTFMYHPHADEMTQMALGMMGFLIVHPRVADEPRVDRDYAVLLHNWAVHPGTYRPDPSVMVDFDLWTFNSKVFPAIEPMVARRGERVRIRVANLSMWNHPIHLHGHRFVITGSDGGRRPASAWVPEVTEIVGVGQARDLEFVADNPGDWAFHCHMSHHTMNAMGHGIPNPIGVNQRGVDARVRAHLPGYMAMGQGGMAEHGEHLAMGLSGPENTLPMMTGQGPFGPLEMGGMFTLLKVREDLPAASQRDPGWYAHPKGSVAWKESSGSPPDGETR
jgi:FtsP/CotA-like multicopper oxidase with cupredoxin domain